MPIRSSAARRERARAEARHDILLAAAEVFATHGYAEATLAQLAAAAGFAAPSLYRYFESKEEIFRSLAELARREIGATFDAPVDRAAPLAARLEALLAAQYRLAESRRAVFAVLRDAGADAPDELRRLGSPSAGLAFYAEQLAAWLRTNAARGELGQPVDVAARALAGIVFAFRPRDGEPIPDLPRLVVRIALEGIAGRAPVRSHP
jgi:AcrR family transcriptional regulator